MGSKLIRSGETVESYFFFAGEYFGEDIERSNVSVLELTGGDPIGPRVLSSLNMLVSYLLDVIELLLYLPEVANGVYSD